MQQFVRSEVCETLGHDDKWYPCTIREQAEDGTYRLVLNQFENVTWINVPAFNIRARASSFQKLYLSRFSGQKYPDEPSMKPHMFSSFGQEGNVKRSKEIRGLKVDETFTEFDEDLCVERLSLDIDVSETTEFLPSLPESSSMSESGGALSPLNVNLISSANCSFSEKTRMRSGNLDRLSSGNLDFSSGRMRSGPNLLHESSVWSEDRLLEFQEELEEEMYRLAQQSSDSSVNPPEITVTAPTMPAFGSMITQVSDGNCMHDFLQRLSSATEMPDGNPEVVWTLSGRRIEFQDRKRGQTYYLESSEFSLSDQIQASVDFDKDPRQQQAGWKAGYQLEVWTGIVWKLAFVVDSDDQSLLTVCPDEVKPRRFRRFGSELRPFGYVEPDSDDEDSSTP